MKVDVGPVQLQRKQRSAGRSSAAASTGDTESILGSASARIRVRLRRAGQPHRAKDNIAEWIRDGELNELECEVALRLQAVLDALVIDTAGDPRTCGTAGRVARMFIAEVFRGRYVGMPQVSTLLQPPHPNQLIVIGPISVRSACLQYLCPVIGKVWIGIVPCEDSNMIGMSRCALLCDWILARPHIQEEAVVMLADELQRCVSPEGLALLMRSDHLCTRRRGMKEPEAAMTNSVMRGAFLKDKTLRREFLSLVHGIDAAID
jgi:GTP cyclohydrolase I